MKKLFIAIVFLFGIHTALCARTPKTRIRPVQHCEFDVHAGLTWPLSRIPGAEPRIGANLGMEFRYNFRRLPLDVGAIIDIAAACHQPSGLCNTQSNRTVTFGLTGDWNFRQCRRVNPFAGIGVGIGLRDVLCGGEYSDGDGTLVPVLQPRIGVELFHHLRFTLSSTLSGRGYSNVCLSVGFVIGGRPKKLKNKS